MNIKELEIICQADANSTDASKLILKLIAVTKAVIKDNEENDFELGAETFLALEELESEPK